MPWTRWRATVSYWWVCPRNSRGAQRVRVRQIWYFPHFVRVLAGYGKCQSVIRLHVATHKIL
ncbi:hypothetical protein LB504_008334 [Fusarium proliferatum]|nr:hypothetical protein LB504_008334 [Fusarium proliferatum]